MRPGTGRKGWKSSRKAHHDLILLDVHLPDMDGREVCKLIRRAGILTPVIMLTGANSEVDTIFGLDSGANDYVTKPFKLGVLLARIRSQLRQHEQSEDAVFTIGPYRFRPSLRQLQADGKVVRLTTRNRRSEISLPGGREGGEPGSTVERGLGLQCRCHDPHA